MRMLRAAVWGSFVMFGSFGAGSARADGFRCENKVVSLGDSSVRVRDVCGAPDAAEQRTEKRTVRRVQSVPCATGVCAVVVEDSIEVRIEDWTYDFGPHRFMQYLRFESGVLTNVRSGSYGTKES